MYKSLDLEVLKTGKLCTVFLIRISVFLHALLEHLFLALLEWLVHVPCDMLQIRSWSSEHIQLGGRASASCSPAVVGAIPTVLVRQTYNS